MFEIPKVGSIVRVTTRYPNHYSKTAEFQPFIDYVHEGTVLPSWKHDLPFTFNMTGSKEFPERNITMSNVVDMKILRGAIAKKLEKDLNLRMFKVVSKTKTYLVTKTVNTYNCTCIGYQYNKKCKHINAVHKKVG